MMAAAYYVKAHNGSVRFNTDDLNDRIDGKFSLFQRWDSEERKATT